MRQTRETWATWVDEHYEVLLTRSTVLFHGKTEMAADFLHDLLLELRHKWDTVEHPLAWISTTMRYRIADYIPQEKTLSSAEVQDTQNSNDLPLQMDIEAAIDRLPAKLQKVLTLFLEGNNIIEISAQTQLSPDAVYQRLSRARKQLVCLLGDEAHGKNLQRSPNEAVTLTI